MKALQILPRGRGSKAWRFQDPSVQPWPAWGVSRPARAALGRDGHTRAPEEACNKDAKTGHEKLNHERPVEGLPVSEPGDDAKLRKPALKGKPIFSIRRLKARDICRVATVAGREP